jgi:hypothetical protein
MRAAQSSKPTLTDFVGKSLRMLEHRRGLLFDDAPLFVLADFVFGAGHKALLRFHTEIS